MLPPGARRRGRVTSNSTTPNEAFAADFRQIHEVKFWQISTCLYLFIIFPTLQRIQISSDDADLFNLYRELLVLVMFHNKTAELVAQELYDSDRFICGKDRAQHLGLHSIVHK